MILALDVQSMSFFSYIIQRYLIFFSPENVAIAYLNRFGYFEGI